jgi:hypothetical protein
MSKHKPLKGLIELGWFEGLPPKKGTPMPTPHTHRLAANAVLTQDKEWHLTGVTYQPLPCGCTVTGAGVLPAPLTVTHCALHAAAPALYAALRKMVHAYEPLPGEHPVPFIIEESRAALRAADGKGQP